MLIGTLFANNNMHLPKKSDPKATNSRHRAGKTLP